MLVIPGALYKVDYFEVLPTPDFCTEEMKKNAHKKCKMQNGKCKNALRYNILLF